LTWTKQRAQLAGTIRHHPDDHEAIDAARRDLRVARAEHYIRELVDNFPLEQRARFAALLLREGGAA
jgi:hypothetical protein